MNKHCTEQLQADGLLTLMKSVQPLTPSVQDHFCCEDNIGCGVVLGLGKMKMLSVLVKSLDANATGGK